MPEPAPAGQQAGERRYSVYGVTVASEFPFQTPLLPAEGTPDLTFTSVSNPPEVGPWRDSEPIFESRYLTEDGEPQMRLYRHGDFHVFRQVGLADYYMCSDRIVCHQRDEAATDVVELSFLSLLTGFWLESRGAVVLHASAVSVHGRAAVFLATNKGGKTSLSASLMQMGYPLLTDDFLAVSLVGDEAVAHPSFPQMRMWPDLANHFLGGHAHLPLVVPETDKRRVAVGEEAFGSFCTDETPVSRLYLPERADDSQGPIRVEPIPPQQALIELVRESFLGTVLEKAGLHRERFARLASLVRRIPMARLVYPAGLDRLPEVREAILEDMGGDR